MRLPKFTWLRDCFRSPRKTSGSVPTTKAATTSNVAGTSSNIPSNSPPTSTQGPGASPPVIPIAIIRPPTSHSTYSASGAVTPTPGTAPAGAIPPSPTGSSLYLQNLPSSVGTFNNSNFSLNPIGGLSLPPNYGRPATPSSAPVEVIIGQVLNAMQSFREKQWKYKDKNGGEVIVSEKLDDVLNRIRQYTNVTNILVSSDPAIAALAWGGFNLLLQIAGNDAEMAVKVAEAMADIIDYIHIYQPYREQYIHSETESGKKLYGLLLRLYADITEFCELATKYYQKSTAKRIGKSVITPFSIEFGPILQKIKNTTGLIHSAAASAEFEDTKRLQLLQWLSSVHHQDSHENNRRTRSDGTCDWLLQKDQFVQWKQAKKSSLLWLNGNVGCGKSVLISNVVDHLLNLPGRSSTQEPVAYFYCNYDDIQTVQPAIILATILKQLVASRASVPRVLTAAFTLHQSRGSPSTKHSLKDIEAYLIEVLHSSELTSVFLVLDGLDECPLTPKRQNRHVDSRVELLRSLTSLIDQFSPSHSKLTIKILVASRPMGDISFRLEKYPKIEIEGNDNKSDIITYIKSNLTQAIADGRGVRRPIEDEPALEQLIVDTITGKVNGMFLWAKLLLDQICDENTVAAIKKALKDLPDEYQEVYLRILKNLEAHTPANRQLAKRAIAWVFGAIRPLSVAELTEALIVDIPGRRIEHEAKCGGQVILEVCLNLIVTETYGGNTYFRFVHFSVHEFFRELKDLEPKDIPPGLEPSPDFDFSVNRPEVEHEILSTSLSYLSFDSFNRGPWDHDTLYECRNSFETFIRQHPFLDYAAVFWTHHLTNVAINDELTSLISLLFGLHSNIGLSFQVYWFRNLVDGFPLNIPPQHIASFFGLEDPLCALLNSLGVDAANFTDGLGRNCLHWAVLNGHKKVTELLLNWDVDVKTIDMKGYNALGLASLGGHREVVCTLLAKRKDVFREEKEQLSVALLAATQGCYGEVVGMLLDAGADPNLHINEAMDPLWVAAWKGDLEIVNQLLDAGAEVDNGRKYGNALQEAAANGSQEVVATLIAAGADVNARGGTAGTALNAAAWRGHYDIVELLLSMDATIQFDDDKFGGALTLAQSQGHNKVVDLILDYAPNTIKIQTTAMQSAAEPQDNSTQVPIIPSTLSNPLSGITVEGMDFAVRSVFATIEQGEIAEARIMMAFGANILSNAIDNEDLAFIERFCEAITHQADSIQKVKNTELMDLIYSLFDTLFRKVQVSVHRETILGTLRAAISITLQKLLNETYTQMLKGLVYHRETKLMDLISGGNQQEAEAQLRFAEEWIRIGIRVRGHSLIARGFAKAYVTGVEALLRSGSQSNIMDDLESGADSSSGGLLKSGLGCAKEELVLICEIAHVMRMGEFPIVQKRFDGALAKLANFLSVQGKAEVDEILEKRINALIAPTYSSAGEEWEQDIEPWWESYQFV